MQKDTKWILWLAVALVAVMPALTAQAQYSGEVWENISDPNDATDIAANTSGPSHANFNLSAVDFGVFGTDTVADFLDDATLTDATASFNPNAQIETANLYIQITGLIELPPVGVVFQVGNADGLVLNINGLGTVISEPGPLPLYSQYLVTYPSGGDYDFTLDFNVNFNQDPAILSGFQLDDSSSGLVGAGTPDAAATLPLLGAAMTGLLALGRKFRK